MGYGLGFLYIPPFCFPVLSFAGSLVALLLLLCFGAILVFLFVLLTLVGCVIRMEVGFIVLVDGRKG